MTIAEVESLLSIYNPDHYPSISVTKGTTLNVWEVQISLNNNMSIIKFTPKYYNGNWECFSPEIIGDVYRHPSLIGIIDYILSIHPALLYSPTLSPERFL